MCKHAKREGDKKQKQCARHHLRIVIIGNVRNDENACMEFDTQSNENLHKKCI